MSDGVNAAQGLMNMIGNIAMESKKDFAFLVAVEADGVVHLCDVVKSGYDIRNARVIYVTEVVQDYAVLADALKDLGMQWGLVEWLTAKLEDEDDRFVSLRTKIEYWKLRAMHAEKRERKVSDELAEMEDKFDELIDSGVLSGP